MPTLKVMTWNVENLFRPAPGAPTADQQRYQQKLALLASVIGPLDIDVVGLQEIGGEEPLLDLQQALGASYPHRATSAAPDTRGIRVAFLSKLRIWANSLLEGNPSSPLVLLGDFNDVPEAQTSLVLNGPEGSEIGTPGFDRPDQGDDARLFNLANCITEARRFSRVHRGRGELLDQIFVSEELLPLGPNGRRVLPAVDSHVDFVGALASITENPGDRAKEIAPDHAPVTATFTF